MSVQDAPVRISMTLPPKLVPLTQDLVAVPQHFIVETIPVGEQDSSLALMNQDHHLALQVLRLRYPERAQV